MRRMSVTQNNVFVHSNPPKAISGSGALIRQWVKSGDVEKLEGLVLEGQGARLLGLMEAAGDAKVKAFLRTIPGYMAKVDSIHDAVIRGSLRETQTLIDKKKLATARDAVGRGVTHKAVLYNNKPIIEWLAKKYPETLNLKDNESRTCLHYAAAAREPDEMYKLLLNLGSNPELVDIHGRKAIYYMSHPDELDIEGPARSLSRGKRRRISPISQPKRKLIVSPPSITRAQIRIWIHEKEIPKLEKIVWSGNGDKLLLETSNNGKVRRFLDNVPHLLSRIKSIHTAAINNDLDGMKDMRRKTELIEVFKAKDAHGLNALHKAAGLGNRPIIEYLIYEVPELINEADNEGRTPLHYAAREQNVYSFLAKAGANEDVLDQKGRTPSYYRNHPLDLDARHLRNIPDAPRVSGDISGWDRASPFTNMAKRRTSSGEFSQNQVSGKYDLLDNVELNEAELQADDLEFQPAGQSRALSKGLSEHRAISRVEEARTDLSRAQSRAAELSRSMAKTEEDRAVSRTNGNRAVSRTEEDRAVSRTEEDRAVSRTDEDRAVSRTEADRAASGAGENRAASRTEEGRAASRTEGDRAVSRTEENRAVSRTEDDRAESRNQGSRAVSRTEESGDTLMPEDNRAVSRTEGSRATSRTENERAVSRTDGSRATSRTENERAESKTERSRATSRAENDRAGSRTDNDRPESGAENERAISRTEESRAKSRTENDRAGSKTEGERSTSRTENERAVSRTDDDRAVSRTQNDRSVSRTDETRAGPKTGHSRAASRTEDARAVSRTEEALARSRAASREEEIVETSTGSKTASRMNSKTELIDASGGSRTVSRRNSKISLIETPVGSRNVTRENSKNDLAIRSLSREGSKTDMLDGRKSGFGRSDTFIREAAEAMEEEGGGEEPMEETLDDQVPIEPLDDVDEPFETAVYDAAEPEAEADTAITGMIEEIEEAEAMDAAEQRPATGEGNDEDVDDIEAALKRGDMESLVDRILDGRGTELLNRKTANRDVQDFLSNVPAYMAKIASIHSAAGSGNLRDLQTLLDRKRLALAKDGLGRGPLHQAVLNNHTVVARHLASNYPQTLKLLDRKGRSALHYAATLPDSGSMFKTLVNLGADPNVKDIEGNTGGIYLRNRELLTNQDLLDERAAVAEVVEAERWERPSTPPVAVLASLETFYNNTLTKEEGLWTRAWRRLTQKGDSNVKELVVKYLDRQTFDLLKVRGIPGGSLMDVLKFYPQYFIVAPSDMAYDVWQELFVPTIVDHNRLEGPFMGRTSVLGKTLPEFKIPQVDIPSKFVTLVRVRVSRNIKPFPFHPLMKSDDLLKVANILKTVQLNWPCFDLQFMEKEMKEELMSRCWMCEATRISQHWPKHRFLTCSHDSNAQVCMNAEDHLDIIVSSKYGKLYAALETLNDVYSIFEQEFEFYENEQFGFLTVDPFRVGTGMKITFRIRLPTLMKEKTELLTFCHEHNLSVRWRSKSTLLGTADIEPEDWIELENNRSLGYSELELSLQIAQIIVKLIQAEESRTRQLILIEKENSKRNKS